MYNIDVYQYIATNEPRRAANLIKSYGYVIKSRDMAQNLRDLVNFEGDNAVEELMKLHPDYDYFMDKNSFNNFSGSIEKTDKNYEFEKYAYLKASGDQQNNQILQQNNIASLTNVSIIVAGLLLATAIISKK
jgi:hypothetical protein